MSRSLGMASGGRISSLGLFTEAFWVALACLMNGFSVLISVVVAGEGSSDEGAGISRIVEMAAMTAKVVANRIYLNFMKPRYSIHRELEDFY